jgi:S-adenosylmethionine decarboxylase
MMGDHFLLNLYQCNSSKLDDEKFLVSMLERSVQLGEMTLLNLITHKFDPQGITAVALLSESHISIHTWPEDSSCAVDVYTCGDTANPRSSCDFIIKELECSDPRITHIKRI